MEKLNDSHIFYPLDLQIFHQQYCEQRQQHKKSSEPQLTLDHQLHVMALDEFDSIIEDLNHDVQHEDTSKDEKTNDKEAEEEEDEEYQKAKWNQLLKSYQQHLQLLEQWKNIHT
ncbi:unnamed protein product [Adineta steineri]|uniref:Uncharacterized protein n=1 Tax=Adineta steineri TaxID=433720 RepID=A0A816A6M7_9BILA|nr:unnamed protein product [Adineta steineri]CAF1592166.1 unnamed protein product [Adineta steineri]